MVFEFVVAAVLFIGIMVFVLNMLNSNVSVFSEDYRLYSLEGRVVSVSEAMVKTREGVGLAKEWPVLNSSKIADVDYFCSFPGNYTAFLSKLSLLGKPRVGTFEAKVVVTDTVTEVNLLECSSPSGTVGSPFSTIERFGVSDLDGSVLKVSAWVW